MPASEVLAMAEARSQTGALVAAVVQELERYRDGREIMDLYKGLE